MQWAALKLYLAAGPARRFDVRALRSPRPSAGGIAPPLFDSPRLNESILLKGLPIGRDSVKFAREANAPTAMIVLLPDDPDRPGIGGASCIFAEGEEEVRCRRWLIQQTTASSEMDIAKLRMLCSVPTFSKPLLYIAFRRAGITVAKCYADFPPAARAKLESHLRARLRSLMVVVSGTTRMGDVEPSVERFIDRLLRPTAGTQGGLAPLINGLRLPPKSGWDILSAWVGLAYYELLTQALQAPSRDFVSWMKIARSRERLHGKDQELMNDLLRTVQQRARDTWHQLIALSQLYREAHEAMAFGGNSQQFLEFLRQAPEHYRWVGEVVGRLEQCICIWKHAMTRFNDRPLPYSELFELGTMLCQVLSPIEPPGAFAANQRLSA